MAEHLSINGTDFISASDAGSISKYTSDYITKLARTGKVTATRIGHRWYINPESLETFTANIEAQKKQRAEEIRLERKQEQETYLQISKPDDVFKEPEHNRWVAFQQTLIILALGLSLGIGGYSFTSQSIGQQEAVVVEGNFAVLKRLALSFYLFISPHRAEHYVNAPVSVERSPKSESSTTTYTSIIVAPDEVFTESQAAEIRESFSDEVDIAVDPKNPDMGIITPVFRDRRGEPYRFLIMPANPLPQIKS